MKDNQSNTTTRKTKQSRIEKTIKATFSLYGCDQKTTKINAILRDENNGDLIVFFTRTKKNYIDEFDPKPRTLKLTEYVSFNNRYVWGVRVGFFCGVSEELKHFESVGHYTRIK